MESWRVLVVAVAVIVPPVPATSQILVAPLIDQPGALVICVDTRCFGEPRTLLLPPTPRSLSLLPERPGQTCSSSQAPPEAVMSPERTHLVRVFRNAAQPRSFEMFLVGRGVRLLTDDDSGWFRAEGSPAAPAVAHIALQRGADAPVEGVLYVSDGEGFEHWVLLVAARVPQYVTQTYGSGALSVGLLGTHQSGFSLQATPPPLGYRNALRCHWSVGGGSCGSGVRVRWTWQTRFGPGWRSGSIATFATRRPSSRWSMRSTKACRCWGRN